MEIDNFREAHDEVMCEIDTPLGDVVLFLLEQVENLRERIRKMEIEQADAELSD